MQQIVAEKMCLVLSRVLVVAAAVLLLPPGDQSRLSLGGTDGWLPVSHLASILQHVSKKGVVSCWCGWAWLDNVAHRLDKMSHQEIQSFV